MDETFFANCMATIGKDFGNIFLRVKGSKADRTVEGFVEIAVVHYGTGKGWVEKGYFYILFGSI